MTDTDLYASSPSAEVKDTAKEQAQSVAATTKDEAANVVETAKEQAQAVTSDLREQTRQLTSEARSQLTDHAIAQRDNAVSNLRSIGDELTGMSDRAERPGIGAELTRNVGDIAYKSADFLQEREPGQLVDELRNLARRRPGSFLLGAAFAGLLVGRLTRSAKSAHSTSSENGPVDHGTALATQAEVGAAYDPASVVPVSVPQVEPDAWGPVSPTYPASISSEAEPGVMR